MGIYPMYHAALVRPQVPAAHNRCVVDYDDYAGDPSVWFDGGYEVEVGGGVYMTPYYMPAIVSAGARPVPPLQMITSIDWTGDEPDQIRVHIAIGNGVDPNASGVGPATAPAPQAGTRSVVGGSLSFESSVVDPDGHDVFVMWDWGDGQSSDWIGPYPSGSTFSGSHSWAADGDYEVTVKSRDAFFAETTWSAPIPVRISCCTERVGDANNSAADEPSIGDVAQLVDHLFINKPLLDCVAESDINQSGGAYPSQDQPGSDITIGDVAELVDYLFITGPDNGVLRDCL